MKSLHLSLAVAAALTFSEVAPAGEYTPPPQAPVEAEDVGSAVSGTLSLNFNTHFISYGIDVWGNGGSTFSDNLFNPSLELVWDLGTTPVGDLSFILGTWWDVNSNANSNIGRNIQEIDVWAGFGLTAGIFDFTLLYQEWMYGSQSERNIDFVIAADVPFDPSLTIHGRIDPGASGGDEGAMFVLGADALAWGEGVALGPVSFSVPVNIAFGTSFHPGVPPNMFGDSGFAFASAGLQASVPLAFVSPDLGEWSLNGGFTYYYTSDDAIPTNPADDFWTANVGISVSF